MVLRILFLKTEKLSDFLRGESRVVPFNYGRWKKRVLEKVVFCVWRRSNMYISGRVKRTSNRNQAEEIFRIFILQDLRKKAKFSTPASISKGLQSQFFIGLSFEVSLRAPVKAGHAFYLRDSSFSFNELLKA